MVSGGASAKKSVAANTSRRGDGSRTITGAGYYPARVADVAWTVVVGAGGGIRYGALKQYEALGEARVIDLSKASAASVSDGVVLVVAPADAVREGAVAGGATRSESVRRGLAAVPDEATI